MYILENRGIYQQMLHNINRDGVSMDPMNGIKVDKGFYTVYELKRRFDAKEKRIIIDSDFQREDVWNLNRKIELVESVLMGLPLPIFYFTQDKYGKLIVVDGRQRLTALFDYMSDKYPLKNLKILSSLNGRKFSNLAPVLQSRIEDFQIQAHVIMPPTPDRIKFDIFERVNRGGVQLNKQEIRNALYQGNATKLLGELAGSSAFAKATGNAFEKEKRMKDRYLLTRFITFYLEEENKIIDDYGNLYIYRDDIDEFLGKGLETVNRMTGREIENLSEVINNTLEKSYYYLGEDAFRMNRGERKSPINMNVFETVMFCMLRLPEKNHAIRGEVQRTVIEFINSEAFRNNIGNHRDSVTKLGWRLESADRIGRKLCGYAE